MPKQSHGCCSSHSTCHTICYNSSGMERQKRVSKRVREFSLRRNHLAPPTVVWRLILRKAVLDLSSRRNRGSLFQRRAGTGWQVDSILLASACILLASWELPPVVFCALSEVSQAWLLLLRMLYFVFHSCSMTSFFAYSEFLLSYLWGIFSPRFRMCSRTLWSRKHRSKELTFFL